MNKDDLCKLDLIAHEIGQYCIKYGRIAVTQTKEKFGTVRVYCSFGIWSLHSLIWPHYVYKHPSYPQWLWKLDCSLYGSWFARIVNVIIFPWQKFIYNRAYQKAIKKYPHLKDDITCAADYEEYLDL